MSILNDLYYGRIRYDEKPIKPKSEHEQIAREVVDIENTIRAELPTESRKLFDEYTEKYDRMTDIVAFESFTKGTQFALLLMAEAIGAGGE